MSVTFLCSVHTAQISRPGVPRHIQRFEAPDFELRSWLPGRPPFLRRRRKLCCQTRGPLRHHGTARIEGEPGPL